MWDKGLICQHIQQLSWEIMTFIFLVGQILVQSAERSFSHEAEAVAQVGDKSCIVVDKLYQVNSMQLLLDGDKAQIQVLACQWV
jgi:hypothetical protein